MHAIQWHGAYGIIEHLTGPAVRFTDFDVVQPYLDVWQARRDELDNPPPLPVPTLAEAKASRRGGRQSPSRQPETQGFIHLGRCSTATSAACCASRRLRSPRR